MMCMVLSPNCCAVTIFEYSTTEVTLPSCLTVAGEHVASESKWQSADLDLLKLAKAQAAYEKFLKGFVYVRVKICQHVTCSYATSTFA